MQITQIQTGNNPRRYIDPAELEELTNSVRSLGVLQPIVVKKNDGEQFTIVAGHRRFAAAKAAGLDDIPVHIIDDDVDTQAAALAENVMRADMSPSEECDAALVLLKKNKGDIKEVSILLGWTEEKLRRRLALAACSQEVRNALAERKIKLGIAELLATVPEHDNQNRALEKIIANNLGVAEVRSFLSKLTQKLSKAIFDKTDCQGCRFNTEHQASLFTEVISEDGYCTNGSCFAAKTEAAVVAKAQSLNDEYTAVHIVGLGDPEDYTKLRAEGEHGVGESQCKACKQCASFGAIVWKTPGHEGEVEDSMCFNLSCNEKMVEAAHPKLTIPVVSAQNLNDLDDDQDPAPSVGGVEQAAGETANDEGDGDGNEAGCAGSECAKQPDLLTNAVREYRRGIWNSMAMVTLAKQPDKGHIALIAILAKGLQTDRLAIAKVANKYGASATDLGAFCEELEAAKDKMGAMTSASAASSISIMSEQHLRSLLHYLNPDMAEFWTLNETYLKLLTKSHMEAVCEELGISEKLPEKAFSGKKDEIISAIMKSGVDFKGLIPEQMKY